MLTHSLDSFGQDIVLKGIVINKETKAPIAFSTAEIKALKTGVYSDSSGKFSLVLKEKDLMDSVEFLSLGYERKKYRINDLVKTSENVVELQPDTVKLKEIVVVPHKVRVARIGITSKKPWSFQIANTFGGQYGHYIQNKDRKPGYVNAVSYYLAKPGFPNAPFRVRIYGRDSLNNCPGKDLLNKNVIVSSSKGEGWFTVDISKYGVDFPIDGMYVMMEWVYSGDQYYFDWEEVIRSKDGKSEKKIQHHPYGQSLGNVNKQSDGGFWARGLGVKWNRWNGYYKGYVNVMINADIVFFQ